MEWRISVCKEREMFGVIKLVRGIIVSAARERNRFSKLGWWFDLIWPLLLSLSVAPGKRPLSSQSPYIIENKETGMLFAGGCAGGSRIISANVQVAHNVLVSERHTSTAKEWGTDWHSQLVRVGLQHDCQSSAIRSQNPQPTGTLYHDLGTIQPISFICRSHGTRRKRFDEKRS